MFDVWVMLISGIVGFLMRRHGFGPAPLVMGLILGGILEERFSQAMIMFDNNWLRFLESTIVNLFLFLTMMGLFWPFLGPLIRRSLRRGPSQASDR